MNHNSQMLCCEFNVNFQNVKPPYSNGKKTIEEFVGIGGITSTS